MNSPPGSNGLRRLMRSVSDKIPRLITLDKTAGMMVHWRMRSALVSNWSQKGLTLDMGMCG